MQPVSQPLTPEEINFALNVLAAEERPKNRWLNLLGMLVLALVISLATIGLWGGLVTIWFDRAVGLRFFLLCVLSFVVGVLFFFLIGIIGSIVNKNFDIDDLLDFTKAKESIQNSELGRAAQDAWGKRQGYFYIYGFLLFIVSVGGCFWFTLVLAKTNQLSIPALVLMVLPVFAAFLMYYVQFYREDQYYRSVSKVRDRLEKASPDPLSNFDYTVLAQAETRMVKQSVEQMATQVAQPSWYSVTIGSEVSESLKSLPEEQRDVRYAFREAADNLQFNPLPPDAQPLPGQANTYSLQVSGTSIIYTVDEEKKRIEIVALTHSAPGGLANVP
jgi:mRNA-degrading endonuclease RelE of RelBE toxin-antitoxin system